MVYTDNDTLLHLRDYKLVPHCIRNPSSEEKNYLHTLSFSRNDYIDTIPKVNYLTTVSLMEYLNVTEEFVFIINDWGYFNKTSNQWTGMVKQLMDNHLDVSGMKIVIYKLPDDNSSNKSFQESQSYSRQPDLK